MKNTQIDEKKLLSRFLDYVQIDSESGHEGAFARRLVQDLEAIGLEVTTDQGQHQIPSDGYNIYATLPGDPSLEPILFCCHMDTVVPGNGIKPQVSQDGYVRSDGSTILGGDDKSGVAAILEGVALAGGLPRRPTVEVVFTVCEEVGLLGAKSLDYNRIISKKGIVFDSGGGPNKIITQGPGQNELAVTVTGLRAHAGVEPEKGISAIQVAALAVSRMNLLRIDPETTCNIGRFLADGPTNIVSPQAELLLEVRSRNKEKLSQQTQHLVFCLEEACQTYGAQLEYEIRSCYESFSYSDQDPWVFQVKEAVSSLGLPAETQASGGGSDANVLCAQGISILNLGVGMEQVHTTKEQQNIQQMVQAIQVCYQIIALAGA